MTAHGAINRSGFTRRRHALARRRFCDFVTPATTRAEVIVDWVPAHFPTDEHGLGRFDGRPLYEHADPREGMHPGLGHADLQLRAREVFNYLVGNALFWIEHYGGVDGSASMRSRRCSTATTAVRPAEWIPNIYGGRENLEAVISAPDERNHRPGMSGAANLRRRIDGLAVGQPSAVDGGLGFHYKWNMGWMHDILDYMQHDPIHRRYHHNQLTFGLLYAFTEKLRPAAVARRGGARQGFADQQDVRRLLAEIRQPAPALRFHVGASGQEAAVHGRRVRPERVEPDAALDWNLLDFPQHDGVRQLIRDLNKLLPRYARAARNRLRPGRLRVDIGQRLDNSVLPSSAADLDRNAKAMLCVATSRRSSRHDYRIGVPGPGVHHERSIPTRNITAAATSATIRHGRRGADPARSRLVGRADPPPLAAIFL